MGCLSLTFVLDASSPLPVVLHMRIFMGPCWLESPLVHLLGLVNDHNLGAMLGRACGVE